jgi:hypothetical protein
MRVDQLVAKVGMPVIAALLAVGLGAAVLQTYVVMANHEGPGSFTPSLAPPLKTRAHVPAVSTTSTSAPLAVDAAGAEAAPAVPSTTPRRTATSTTAATTVRASTPTTTEVEHATTTTTTAAAGKSGRSPGGSGKGHGGEDD